MITRILTFVVLIIWTTNAQFVPLTSHSTDCALVLSGPGKSSSFDYALNVFRSPSSWRNDNFNGGQTCITYDAINAAYLDARKRIHVSTPKGDWKTEDIASVGELVLDISIQLARTYGLSYEDIENGLPTIDTSKTLIHEVCPPFLSGVDCRPGKYRRFDGLCNNLENPTWGAAMTPFQRLVGPLYADGINAPRISVTGRDLPLSRVVSRTLHPDDGFHDHAGTVMVIAWGQFMDHDFTLTGTPLDPINRNDPEECCKRPPHLKHPYCNEIRIPDDDYFYRLFNVKCIDFVRGFPSPRPGCRLGSRQQFNTLTGVIDGNTVYGVNEKFARKLRTGYGGLMRMNPVFQEYGLKDLLPLKLDVPDEGCTRPNKSMYCFEAGEIRVNEQLVLTCMHTLMAREHNRVATGLAQVNPHWDDETLFQETRRINIAIIQHVTYNEFAPILLGKEVMEKFGIVTQKEGYWDGYDPHINPSIIDAFAAAAFRFGHSLLPTAVERWSKAHKFIASKRLSDLIRRPYDLYRAGVLDEYFMGLMNQVAQAMDDSITQEVTNHLFKKEGARFGMDLVSFNMQRGREFGVPGYMEFRKFCGLPTSHSWEEMFGSMPNETIARYQSIFDTPEDIDLWSGGVSERSLPGSMLGPTFACIIATQLSYLRRGDRFWYELPNQPSSFSPEQLQEIRKAKLSRLICDNTDLIDSTQIYPMVLPDHELNPRVPCKSGIIPSIDLSKWADFGHEHSPNQYSYLNELSDSLPIYENNYIDRRKRSSIEFVYNDRPSKAIEDKFNDFFGTEVVKQSPSENDTKQTQKQYNSGDASEVTDLANDEFFFKQFTPKKFQDNKKLQDDVEIFDHGTFFITSDTDYNPTTKSPVVKPVTKKSNTRKNKNVRKNKRKNTNRKNQTNIEKGQNLNHEIIEEPEMVDPVEGEIQISIQEAVKNLQVFNNEFTENFENFANNPKWRKKSSLRHEGDEDDDDDDEIEVATEKMKEVEEDHNEDIKVNDDENIEEENEKIEENENIEENEKIEENSFTLSTPSKINESHNGPSSDFFKESINIDPSVDLINEFNDRINKRRHNTKPLSTQKLI